LLSDLLRRTGTKKLRAAK